MAVRCKVTFSPLQDYVWHVVYVGINKKFKMKEKIEMEQKILELLSEEYPEIDFTSSDALVDDGILDSLTITGIIAALSMEFEITIPYEEIIEENFNSISGLAKMVQRLLE